jgi:hypothetical protein
MMPKGNLVKSVSHGKLEERLSTVPCTKETACLSWIGTLIKTRVKYMQLNAKLITEVLEIRAVGLVWDIIHNDMCSLNRYLRFIDTRTLSHQSGKHERVLASRKRNKDAVTI